MIKKIMIISVLCIFLISSPLAMSLNLIKEQNKNVENEEVTIRIAQYPRYCGCDHSVGIMFNYAWFSNGTLYKYEITELSLDEVKGEGENPLNNDNFDIFYVGASFDVCVKDALDPKLTENIRNFVKNGGGYLGSCAGATFASSGYENNSLFERYINRNILKIINVYINDGLNEELSYIMKWQQDDYWLTAPVNKSQGLVPMSCKVRRDNNNPIFSCYTKENLTITYGGGPGMYPADINDPNMGDVVPLLEIDEELMETKPIYWYRKKIFGYAPVRKVKTDLKGQYNSVATTYGDGKIVVFGAHPEIPPVINGYIHEFASKKNLFGINKDVKRVWFSYAGEPTNMSYNWWIYRRAAAWTYGIPDEDFPPYEELTLDFIKPTHNIYPTIYLNDNVLATFQTDQWFIYYDILSPYFKIPIILKTKIGQRIGNKIISRSVFGTYLKTVIIGDLSSLIYSEGCKNVEFYIDDELLYTNNTGTVNNGSKYFKYKMDINNLNGMHNFKVIGYGGHDSFCWIDEDFLFFNS